MVIFWKETPKQLSDSQGKSGMHFFFFFLLSYAEHLGDQKSFKSCGWVLLQNHKVQLVGPHVRLGARTAIVEFS